MSYLKKAYVKYPLIVLAAYASGNIYTAADAWALVGRLLFGG